ncbi:MAG TPA: cytochrome c3 family protein [Isosphaeraceae bacterium]|jgi:predicted CXXCH cytochrome family protein|nr:cytochrome c3 family protein [Isosphaeraceae bacterium]
MALAQTGKQRAKGVPLDYFKHIGPLERWKRRLTLAALMIAVGWWVSGLELSREGWPIRQSARGRLRASRGPVTRVHASWEANCNACHVPFTPIVSEHWSSVLVPGEASVSDQRCTDCHAGPPHHESQASLAGLTCAGCHREHRGRDVSLVRMSDGVCTQCHSHLAAHTRPGAPAKGYLDITSFVSDHPEFRWVKERGAASDPGEIEFNHALHMTRGLVHKPGDVPFTLLKLADQADRDRYRQADQADTDAAQLNCTSCHRTDGGDLTANAERVARRPTRTSGAYMLPIVYENQCRACHPLDVEPRAVADKPRTRPLEIPHGVQPDELHDSLERTFVARYLSEHPDMLDQPAPLPRMPTKAPSAEAVKARRVIDDQVYLAEKILYLGKQTCSECHRYETPGDLSATESIGRGERPRLRVKSSTLKEVWFEHANFDHSAHRAVSCRECHSRAYPKDQKGADDSISSRDVLLPGIATCRTCHAPSRLSDGQSSGGAAYECTECHRYHNGDAPLQGLGAGRRAALHEHGIQELLTNPHASSARGNPR